MVACQTVRGFREDLVGFILNMSEVTTEPTGGAVCNKAKRLVLVGEVANLLVTRPLWVFPQLVGDFTIGFMCWSCLNFHPEREFPVYGKYGHQSP